jgi:hypothetical protein
MIDLYGCMWLMDNRNYNSLIKIEESIMNKLKDDWMIKWEYNEFKYLKN